TNTSGQQEAYVYNNLTGAAIYKPITTINGNTYYLPSGITEQNGKYYINNNGQQIPVTPSVKTNSTGQTELSFIQPTSSGSKQVPMFSPSQLEALGIKPGAATFLSDINNAAATILNTLNSNPIGQALVNTASTEVNAENTVVNPNSTLGQKVASGITAVAVPLLAFGTGAAIGSGASTLGGVLTGAETAGSALTTAATGAIKGVALGAITSPVLSNITNFLSSGSLLTVPQDIKAAIVGGEVGGVLGATTEGIGANAEPASPPKITTISVTNPADVTDIITNIKSAISDLSKPSDSIESETSPPAGKTIQSATELLDLNKATTDTKALLNNAKSISVIEQDVFKNPIDKALGKTTTQTFLVPSSEDLITTSKEGISPTTGDTSPLFKVNPDGSLTKIGDINPTPQVAVTRLSKFVKPTPTSETIEQVTPTATISVPEGTPAFEEAISKPQPPTPTQQIEGEIYNLKNYNKLTAIPSNEEPASITTYTRPSDSTESTIRPSPSTSVNFELEKQIGTIQGAIKNGVVGGFPVSLAKGTVFDMSTGQANPLFDFKILQTEAEDIAAKEQAGEPVTPAEGAFLRSYDQYLATQANIVTSINNIPTETPGPLALTGGAGNILSLPPGAAASVPASITEGGYGNGLPLPQGYVGTPPVPPSQGGKVIGESNGYTYILNPDGTVSIEQTTTKQVTEGGETTTVNPIEETVPTTETVTSGKTEEIPPVSITEPLSRTPPVQTTETSPPAEYMVIPPGAPSQLTKIIPAYSTSTIQPSLSLQPTLTKSITTSVQPSIQSTIPMIKTSSITSQLTPQTSAIIEPIKYLQPTVLKSGQKQPPVIIPVQSTPQPIITRQSTGTEQITSQQTKQITPTPTFEIPPPRKQIELPIPLLFPNTYFNTPYIPKAIPTSQLYSLYSPSLLPSILPGLERVAEATYNPLFAGVGMRPLKIPKGTGYTQERTPQQILRRVKI
ncbi:MAG: hypothetical protein ACYCU5_14215, partial [Actinomycetes bacterium]